LKPPYAARKNRNKTEQGKARWVQQKNPMDLKDIKAIVDLMKKNSISEFELEKQEFKIRLKRGTNGGVQNVIYDEPQMVQGGYLPQTGHMGTGQPPALPPAATNEIEIKSPMVGTLYRAPSPEAGHYVEIGAEVNAETVVCIIEAMKVMNEIKAEVRGVITQILVENAKPVEFGQPLFKIRPL
jgi:acetyl-CoA carboxylase biotin carboxyl carrier protein